MADDRTAHPVSGDILPDTSKGAAGQSLSTPHDDIVDADYEIVAPAPAPAVEPRAAFMPAGAPVGGMGILRGDAQAAAMPRARGGPLFWVFGLGLVAAAFWVSGGHALVRQAPFLAAEETGAALSISGVVSRVDVSGPRPVLFVDGRAVNGGGSPATLPPLEIQVTGHDGRLTRYRLGTSDQPLQPGEEFAFSSRLDVPKNGVKTVSVTFGE